MEHPVGSDCVLPMIYLRCLQVTEAPSSTQSARDKVKTQQRTMVRSHLVMTLKAANVKTITRVT